MTRIIFGEQYRSLSSSLCTLFHYPVTSSLLVPSILLNTLFSKTLSLHSSLNVSDKVYSLFFHSVHPVTNIALDISNSVYILYIT
jgi:hypothetical protein